MDTEYIKQCEKAEEIQELAPKHLTVLGYGDRIAYDNEGNCWAIGLGKFPTWLPLEHQLQAMCSFARYPYLLVQVFAREVNGGGISYVWNNGQHFTSMEQLWLAFVYKELYNRVWDGEDWIL